MIDSDFHSFLFAQVFGLYFVIMAIILISRADYYKEMIAKLETPGPGIMMVSSLWLLLSLFLVVTHNIWLFGPRVYITIICWFFMVRSVLWLASPERMLYITKEIWKGRGHYILCVAMIVVGVYMAIRGFYLFVENAGALPLGVFKH
jgi:hypothetical protein